MGESDSEVKPVAPKRERLFSLDLLRGLDMFFLVAIAPVFNAIHKVYHWPSGGTMADLFWHASIREPRFALYDLVMPLFIFMCGVAVPYALSSRLEGGRPTWKFWKHVLLRVAMLWVVGVFVCGGGFSLCYKETWIFNNTLEAIACGYLIAALVFLLPKFWMRAALPLILFAVNVGLMVAYSDPDPAKAYTFDGNAAMIFEKFCIKAIQGFEKWNGGYSWYFSIPMFGFMTCCGSICAEILRKEGECKWCKALKLILFTAVLSGLALFTWKVLGMPACKCIWTGTFTAYATAASVAMLVFLYILTDIFRLRWGLGLLILYGQFALTAYLVGECVFRETLRRCAESLFRGVPHLLEVWGVTQDGGQFRELILRVGVVILITAVLLVRRRLKARAK